MTKVVVIAPRDESRDLGGGTAHKPRAGLRALSCAESSMYRSGATARTVQPIPTLSDDDSIDPGAAPPLRLPLTRSQRRRGTSAARAAPTLTVGVASGLNEV